jgi:hypothetical protein
VSANSEPDWFQLSDYDIFENLGAVGWAEILKMIDGFQMKSSGFYCIERPPLEHWTNGYAAWKQLRLRPGPYDYLRELESKPVLNDPNDDDPLYELGLEPGAEDCSAVVRGAGPWVLHPDRFPVIKLDLGCPDEVLLGLFQRWLKKKRAEVPKWEGLEPSKRRGPATGLTPEFKEQFATWANARIIALFDLDFWAENEKTQLTNAAIADLVFRDRHGEQNPGQLVSDARDKLASALRAHSSIALQAKAR